MTSAADDANDVAVKVLTPETLAARMRDLVARLRALTGERSLTRIAFMSLDFELDAPGRAAFDELAGLGFLAGLPSLTCCSSHDEDRTETWADAVTTLIRDEVADPSH